MAAVGSVEGLCTEHATVRSSSKAADKQDGKKNSPPSGAVECDASMATNEAQVLNRGSLCRSARGRRRRSRRGGSALQTVTPPAARLAQHVDSSSSCCCTAPAADPAQPKSTCELPDAARKEGCWN
eukprot:2553089-Rhodomonas_salina.3